MPCWMAEKLILKIMVSAIGVQFNRMNIVIFSRHASDVGADHVMQGPICAILVRERHDGAFSRFLYDVMRCEQERVVAAC